MAGNEPTRGEIGAVLQPVCECPCSFCKDDQHYLCRSRKCGIGPVARQRVLPIKMRQRGRARRPGLR